ncbi:hypothetical protein MMC10_008645 [Thelotrema lepadinum]|nr:hypothetical protein [Thelotrema lepadinum]
MSKMANLYDGDGAQWGIPVHDNDRDYITNSLERPLNEDYPLYEGMEPCHVAGASLDVRPSQISYGSHQSSDFQGTTGDTPHSLHHGRQHQSSHNDAQSPPQHPQDVPHRSQDTTYRRQADPHSPQDDPHSPQDVSNPAQDVPNPAQDAPLPLQNPSQNTVEEISQRKVHITRPREPKRVPMNYSAPFYSGSYKKCLPDQGGPLIKNTDAVDLTQNSAAAIKKCEDVANSRVKVKRQGEALVAPTKRTKTSASKNEIDNEKESLREANHSPLIAPQPRRMAAKMLSSPELDQALLQPSTVSSGASREPKPTSHRSRKLKNPHPLAQPIQPPTKASGPSHPRASKKPTASRQPPQLSSMPLDKFLSLLEKPGKLRGASFPPLMPRSNATPSSTPPHEKTRPSTSLSLPFRTPERLLSPTASHSAQPHEMTKTPTSLGFLSPPPEAPMPRSNITPYSGLPHETAETPTSPKFPFPIPEKLLPRSNATLFPVQPHRMTTMPVSPSFPFDTPEMRLPHSSTTPFPVQHHGMTGASMSSSFLFTTPETLLPRSSAAPFSELPQEKTVTSISPSFPFPLGLETPPPPVVSHSAQPHEKTRTPTSLAFPFTIPETRLPRSSAAPFSGLPQEKNVRSMSPSFPFPLGLDTPVPPVVSRFAPYQSRQRLPNIASFGGQQAHPSQNMRLPTPQLPQQPPLTFEPPQHLAFASEEHQAFTNVSNPYRYLETLPELLNSDVEPSALLNEFNCWKDLDFYTGRR